MRSSTSGARRILPALFVVVIACALASWRWLLPDEFRSNGMAILSVAMFASNIHFWQSSGYFEQAAELQPLLHTWSLGVEEQFYVLYPLLLLLLWRFSASIRLAVLVALLFGSLVISQLLLPERQMVSYFLLPSRAWELLAGSILACGVTAALRRRPPHVAWGNLLCVAGLALVLLPVFLYDERTAFPGLAALPPVVGTALLLVFCTPSTFAWKLLTPKVVVALGLMSYSAYLWHQPLLAFYRLSRIGEASVLHVLAIIMLVWALAYMSWRFVERPFRDRSRFTRRQVLVGGAVSSVFLGLVGALVVVADGFPGRWSAEGVQLLRPPGMAFTQCPVVGESLQVCQLGTASGRPAVALIGDSHAMALADALDERLRETGASGLLLLPACHPVAGMFDSRFPLDGAGASRCAAEFATLLRVIDEHGADTRVVSIRWTGRLYPLGATISAPHFDNGEGGRELDFPFRRNLVRLPDGSTSDRPAVVQRAVSAFLEAVADTGRTAVVYPIPEAGWYAPRLNLVSWNRHGYFPSVISTSWDVFRERNAGAMFVLDAIRIPGLVRIRPEAALCNTLVDGRCVIQRDGVLYYHDDDHLSLPGARLVIEQLVAAGILDPAID